MIFSRIVLLFFAATPAFSQEITRNISPLTFDPTERVCYYKTADDLLVKVDSFENVEKEQTFINHNGEKQVAKVGEIIFRISGHSYVGKVTEVFIDRNLTDKMGALAGGIVTPRQRAIATKDAFGQLFVGNKDEINLIKTFSDFRKANRMPALRQNPVLMMHAKNLADDMAAGRKKRNLYPIPGMWQGMAWSQNGNHLELASGLTRDYAPQILNRQYDSIGVGVVDGQVVVNIGPWVDPPRKAVPTADFYCEARCALSEYKDDEITHIPGYEVKGSYGRARITLSLSTESSLTSKIQVCWTAAWKQLETYALEAHGEKIADWCKKNLSGYARETPDAELKQINFKEWNLIENKK